MNATVEGTRQAVVRGKTNLPAGTILVVTVEREDGEGFQVDDGVAVKAHGRFEAGPFGPDAGLPAGLYRTWVIMLRPADQPAAVRSVVGPAGERLRGPLVTAGDDFQTVALSGTFRVGGESGGSITAEEGGGRSVTLLPGRTGAKTVLVGGYFRKDGTYIRAHWRAAPGDGQHRSTGTGR
jgi:hypothetical protein